MSTNVTPRELLGRMIVSLHDRAETFWWEVFGDSDDGMRRLFRIDKEQWTNILGACDFYDARLRLKKKELVAFLQQLVPSDSVGDKLDVVEYRNPRYDRRTLLYVKLGTGREQISLDQQWKPFIKDTTCRPTPTFRQTPRLLKKGKGNTCCVPACSSCMTCLICRKKSMMRLNCVYQTYWRSPGRWFLPTQTTRSQKSFLLSYMRQS
jgi:hypothetical protein